MDMIEKVARAICATIEPDFSDVAHIDATWDEYIPEARAAIEAMREPTEDMIQAYCAIWEDALPDDAWRAFTAMIDTAMHGSVEGDGKP